MTLLLLIAVLVLIALLMPAWHLGIGVTLVALLVWHLLGDRRSERAS